MIYNYIMVDLCCDGKNCPLPELLEKAHAVVTWTTQDTIRADAAGAGWLKMARENYLLTRVMALNPIRPLTTQDSLGCICHRRIDPAMCPYHLAAKLQPWNHRIPWNCPTFHDGCNCEDGPFYERPEANAVLYIGSPPRAPAHSRTCRAPLYSGSGWGSRDEYWANPAAQRA